MSVQSMIGKRTWISIHALLTESDKHPRRWLYRNGDFNPRSPHGERRRNQRIRPGHPQISIHALLTESDMSLSSSRELQTDFNPRSPHGERPGHLIQFPRGEKISIHALLTESDCGFLNPVCELLHFNPRSPHGERRQAGKRNEAIHLFQSTLSSRRATRGAGRLCPVGFDFNPRSPHGERPFSFMAPMSF